MDSGALRSSEFRHRWRQGVESSKRVFQIGGFGEPSRALFVLLSIAVIGVGAARFLYKLDTPSVFFDEAASWLNSTGSWEHLFARAKAAHDCGGIVFSAVLKIWIHLFGASELSLRMPAVIASLAFVGLMVWVGERLWGRKAGLYVGLAACLHADTLMLARQARAYGFLLCFIALAFFGLVTYWRRSRSRGTWLLAIACPLIVMSHLFGFFVVAAIAVVQAGLWWKSTRPPRPIPSFLRATWPLFASLALSLAWTLAMRARVANVLESSWGTEALLGSMLSSYRILLDEWGWIAVGTALMIWNRSERSNRAVALSILAIALSVSLGPGLVSLMTGGNHHFVVGRYLVPIVPCAALACGYALSRAPAVLGLLLALLIFWNPLVHPPARLYAPTAPYGQDARSATRFLMARMTGDDALVVVPAWDFAMLQYYGVPPEITPRPQLLAAWSAGKLDRRLWIAIFDWRRLPRPYAARIDDCIQRKLGGVSLLACDP